MKWLFNLLFGLTKERNQEIPKYRIEPMPCGKYFLQRYEGDLIGYLTVDIVRSEEQAEKAIENLERDCKYFIKEK